MCGLIDGIALNYSVLVNLSLLHSRIFLSLAFFCSLLNEVEEKKCTYLSSGHDL